MPWRKGDYPPSMKNLPSRVRDKAIEIANALLDDGHEEGRAIAIATAKAEEWAENHPDHEHSEQTSKDNSSSSRASAKKSSPVHVVPDGDGWAVKAEGENKPRFEADTKAEAVDKANQLASDRNTSAVIHRKDGTVQESHNYS
ncbi:DUF2188 domain-containing protein [Paenibacillus lutrae]|uniref:DUF2188 domain-containing protein n=1 Tax=Paenibacillus lutrae TaxID=2078573 RepID=A0A7X3FFA6_9BACL|nr:DUF2188 domain-containing protein [Paenibacillus lutrae]MVO98517.1 DUF2188 domain-containing protein [Paenibacillus lutrae]